MIIYQAFLLNELENIFLNWISKIHKKTETSNIIICY